AGQYLGSKGLVDLDHVDVGEVETGAGERLLRSFHRADAHDPRRHARDPTTDNSRERLGAGSVAGAAAGHDHRNRTIVDAGGIAGGCDAAHLEGPQLGECGQIALWTRMLVLGDLDRPGPAP